MWCIVGTCDRWQMVLREQQLVSLRMKPPGHQQQIYLEPPSRHQQRYLDPQATNNKDIWTSKSPPTKIFETSRPTLHTFFSADDGCTSSKKATVDDLIILCIKFPRKLSFPRNLTSVPITWRNQSTKSDFVCRTSVHDYVSIINTVLTFGNSLFLLLERTISSKRPIFIIDNMPTL